ncbi:CocE/NonD family hydrolase [Dactylosporangium sp. NPDC006015]|uniref:CocE/NonD family hydrolase n=1 Tax=Dactylosporangium sp. NPDC006015 TaxID=3154576 RepID=UPI0033B536BA
MAKRRTSLPVCLLSVLAAAVLTAATPAPATAAPAAATAQTAAVATTGFRFVDITGAGGVVLKANVIAPSAAGRYPAIVFPASWGLNDLEYIAQAKAFAGRGYVVVSYTPRGWWASGGEIDTAGPKDMADLSAVIDWTIANTAADPARIGAGGISYGAGISLLGSAFDRRIRAVVAMSGWTDLVYSLYGDQTRHRQSAGLLQLAAALLGNAGPDLTGKLDDFNANRNVAQIMEWAGVRSAATYLDAINASRPAVLIANSWGDSIFPPNQLADFYGRLAGPKRLELRPGDHAIAELTGVAGLPNDVWTSASRWFDQYLAGVATGIDQEPGVLVKPHNAATESYSAWSSFSGSPRRYGLGQIRWWDGTGLLGGNPSPGWSKTLPGDLNTTADGGVVLLTNGAAALTGILPQIWLPSVDRLRAGVWASDRPSTAARIRGIPRVHLNLTGTAAQGTVVAYLYDLDSLGNAKPITHAPATWLGTATGSRSLDFSLSATAYDVPAGHSLTLVVDTTDPLYYDANTLGSTATVAGGSYVDVPLR